MAYTNRERGRLAMQIVVVKCPHALRWLVRAVFKV